MVLGSIPELSRCREVRDGCLIDKKFFDILKREDSRNISFKLISSTNLYRYNR